jgi:integrase
VTAPVVGNKPFAPVFLTATQVEQVAKQVDECALYGLRFVADTGLPAAELQGLRVRDLNLAAGHVEVHQPIRRGERRVAGRRPEERPVNPQRTAALALAYR